MLGHVLQPLLLQLPLPHMNVPGTLHFPADTPGSLPGPLAVELHGHCSIPDPSSHVWDWIRLGLGRAEGTEQ